MLHDNFETLSHNLNVTELYQKVHKRGDKLNCSLLTNPSSKFFLFSKTRLFLAYSVVGGTMSGLQIKEASSESTYWSCSGVTFLWFLYALEYSNLIYQKLKQNSQQVESKPFIIRLVYVIIWICRCNGHIWFELSRLKQRGHHHTHVREEILS